MIDVFAIFAILLPLPPTLTMYAAAFLAAKGAFFFFTGDVISIVDVIAGTYIGLSAFNIDFKFLSVAFVIYLAQKAILSFFSK